MEKAAVEVFPLINNFDPVNKVWLTNIGTFLNDPAARQTFREQLMVFLSSDRFKGAAFDFEEIPLQAQPGFRALVAELGQALAALRDGLHHCAGRCVFQRRSLESRRSSRRGSSHPTE